MPRFQIVVGEEEVNKALGYLILVKKMPVEEAVSWIRDIFTFSYEKDGKTHYTFVEKATGEDIFFLMKKYRALFGDGVHIKKIDEGRK